MNLLSRVFILCILSITVILAKNRYIHFSGYRWKVKTSDQPMNPGNNYFSDSSENVWIDETGKLHLRITNRNEKWQCAEVICQEKIVYGKYTLFLRSRIDTVDKNVTGTQKKYMNAPLLFASHSIQGRRIE